MSEYCKNCKQLQDRLDKLAASRQSRSKALLAAMWSAIDILDESPEINPVNYNHDEVCELNAAAINVYQVLMDAINAANTKLTGSKQPEKGTA